jgi:aminoglycoside 2''-phosphotransferase
MQPDWRMIAQENRGLAIESTRLVGEGWNCIAYLVNNELIFRFPKRPGHWEEFQREIAFLAFAADRLPLPVPRYERVCPESFAAPNGYAVYRYVPGSTLDLDRLSPAEKDAAAVAIAMFLKALHELEPASELSGSLPREDARAESEEYLAAARREIAPRLLPSEAKRLVELLELHLEDPQHFEGKTVVLHADLSCEHVLMRNGSVAGVIDFGDVNWGDSDYDFMYLFVECGETFADSVARRYGHRDPDRLKEKLRYFALIDQVDTVLHGPGLARGGQEEAAWRRLRQFVQPRDTI